MQSLLRDLPIGLRVGEISRECVIGARLCFALLRFKVGQLFA
jgi:hypothetical protein